MVEKVGHSLLRGRAAYTAIGGRVKGWPGAGRLGLLARAAVGFVYPPACPACAAALAATGGLCAECWRETTFISDPACMICGAPVVADRGDDILCDGCAHAPPAWDRGRAALVYEGAGRRLALALKHGDRLDIAPLAARWMARAGAERVARADIVAPVPLHWRRLVRRRFNQSGELAREVAALTGLTPALDLLDRTRATPSQDGRSRAERFANVSGCFRLNRRWTQAARGARILLVDDVMTTGATLSACAEACREAGAAQIDVLTLARVARADWPA